MALDFIRKVFSFGKKPEEAPELAPPAAPADRQVEQAASAEKTARAIPAEEHLRAPSTEERSRKPMPTEAPAGKPGADPTVSRPAEARNETAPPSPPIDQPERAAPPAAPAETVLPADKDVSREPPEQELQPSRRGAPIPAQPVPETSAAPEEPASAGSEVPSASPPPVPPAEPASDLTAAPAESWFQRLRFGLSRTSSQLSQSITGIFTKRKLDEDTLQDLEDVLIRADLGLETAMRVTDALSEGRYGKDISPAEVHRVMAAEIEKVLGPVAKPLELDLQYKPHVILVVGVNGTGKTTTIGKLAAKLKAGGLSVMLAAGDTFRAAAIEQLKIWGERTGSPVVSSKLGADAAGLAYDAYERAKAAGSDVLIIDTAGRLQNKAELMDELAKIVRVLGKHDPDAPHTVLQTLDATTGQNAMNQVEIFKNVAGVNGLVMTKLDGTARGGILVAIAAKHKLPVYFIGIGEGVDDLEPFAAKDFAAAIAGVAQ